MSSKEWIGNHNSTFSILGASNHSDYIREEHDFYATHPSITRALIEYCDNNDIQLRDKTILEPCCGVGHISEVLKEYNLNVISKDLIDRGYGDGCEDFLKNTDNNVNMHIITNPPYKYAKEFVEHSVNMVSDGSYVCMLLKLTFLEGQKRQVMFKNMPPYKVLVFSDRVICARNGDFDSFDSSAIAYAWFIWKKGNKELPVIDWINGKY